MQGCGDKGCISTSVTSAEYTAECQVKEMIEVKCQMLETAASQIKATRWQFPWFEDGKAWPGKSLPMVLRKQGSHPRFLHGLTVPAWLLATVLLPIGP